MPGLASFYIGDDGAISDDEREILDLLRELIRRLERKFLED